MSRTRSILSSRSRLRAAVVAAGALGALTACGGAQPGTAFSVDGVADGSVSLAHVDEVSQALCDLSLPDLEEQGQRVPMSQARSTVVALLVDRVTSFAFADSMGIEPGPAYRAARSESAAMLAQLEAEGMEFDDPDGLLDVLSAPAASQDVLAQAGAEVTGQTWTQGEPSEDILAAGDIAYGDWLDEHEVTVDPRFGLSIDRTGVAPVPTSLSVPVSAGAERAGDPAASVAALTAAQVCG